MPSSYPCASELRSDPVSRRQVEGSRHSFTKTRLHKPEFSAYTYRCMGTRGAAVLITFIVSSFAGFLAHALPLSCPEQMPGTPMCDEAIPETAFCTADPATLPEDADDAALPSPRVTSDPAPVLLPVSDLQVSGTDSPWIPHAALPAPLLPEIRTVRLLC